MASTLIKFHLESAIKSNRYFSQAHYELAKIFLEEQNIKSAIKSLESAINSALEQSLSSDKKAKYLLKNRQFSQAKQYMFKMGLSKYNTSIYLSKLAQIYLDSNDLENAKINALQSLEEYPNQHTAMYILGCIYASNNKWGKASKWFSKSLELNFKDAMTHFSLAKVKQKQKNPKEAIHHYLIAKDLDQCISSISLDKLSKKYPEF